ncbi:MAG: hypothetical protein HW421_775 [Ignavibacteria bacterium]|nr:hypothetical protein [Ignavibacteria bacterium]
MTKKFYSLIYILSFIFLLSLISCSEETKEVQTQEGASAQIKGIFPLMFKPGDTVTITGKNFGANQGSSYIEFIGIKEDNILWIIENNEEISKEAEGYEFWSDTLIKVIAPSDAVSGRLYINRRESNGFEYQINRPTYVNVIDSTVKVSLIISIIFIYLKINKIWKRKHELEVADSQSLIGLGIYIVNCILWVSYYIFVTSDTKSMLDTTIYIFEGTIFFIIGTGIFVKGQRGQRIWHLIIRSLRLERKEADYLIKRFFRPANAEKILNILHQLAMIDNELAPKEQELLESFAKEWNIDYNVEKLNKEHRNDPANNFIRLRKSLAEYLEQDPQKEQVSQLRDMMDAMIQADDIVAAEEELIFNELKGIIDNFLDKEKLNALYHVLIVPQKHEQEELISDMLPEATMIQISGGNAFRIGSYYSHKYAEMICNQYRDMKLFTIVFNPPEEKN